jgi:MFS family permease
VAPAAGTLSDRIGLRPVMVAGMLLQALGLAWFALVATTGAGCGSLVLPLLIAGVGISMAIPTTPAAASARSPRPTRASPRARAAPARATGRISGT